jgi:hypothetical protein
VCIKNNIVDSNFKLFEDMTEYEANDENRNDPINVYGECFDSSSSVGKDNIRRLKILYGLFLCSPELDDDFMMKNDKDIKNFNMLYCGEYYNGHKF